MLWTVKHTRSSGQCVHAAPDTDAVVNTGTHTHPESIATQTHPTQRKTEINKDTKFLVFNHRLIACDGTNGRPAVAPQCKQITQRSKGINDSSPPCWIPLRPRDAPDVNLQSNHSPPWSTAARSSTFMSYTRPTESFLHVEINVPLCFIDKLHLLTQHLLRELNPQTDRQTDRQTNGQTYIETERDRQTDRQTDRRGHDA